MQQKKIMKHFLIILAILVMGVTLTGCHSDDYTTPPPTLDYVKIIVDGEGTFTYNCGPAKNKYTGTACGGVVGDDTYIIGSSQTFTSTLSDDTVANGCWISFKSSDTNANPKSILWNRSSSGNYYGTITELTITNYGSVGGKIEGSFKGKLNNLNNKDVSGSFRVTRFDDGTIQFFLEAVG